VRNRTNEISAILVALFVVILLLLTSHDIGLTWDEPVYIEASKSYIAWFNNLLQRPRLALHDHEIHQFWEINKEHPPFDKIWSGIVWLVARNFYEDITAHRMGNILLAGMLVALVYLIVAPQFGKISGFGAVAALITMPRFFFHAHLAALDVPVTVMIFLVCFIFWRTVDRPDLKWSLLLGFAYGIACSTKINGLVEIPIVLFLWVLIFRRKFYIFIRLILMGLSGFLIWLILWPWLYHDTFQRLLDFLEFMTIDHYHIAQWYLGNMYLPPPWHYPFIMTLVVLPLTLTLLAIIGTSRVVFNFRSQELGWLVIFFALFPSLILAIGFTQAFDDERLLIPSFPFIAVLAGIGFGWLLQGMQKVTGWWNRSHWMVPLTILISVLTFSPQIINASVIYPHLLSYYSEAVGALSGAVNMGFENTYWAETYAEALPYLNKHVEQGALVWVEAHDVMLYYQHIGLLRSDLRIAGLRGSEGIVKGAKGYSYSIKDADYAVIEFRESGFMKDISDFIKIRKPVYGISYYGVPVMNIYKH